MTDHRPIPLSQVDVQKLELRPNTTANKSYFLYHNGIKLRIILPEMTVPKGAAIKFPEKYSLNVSHESCRETLDTLKVINAKVLELISKL